MFNLRWFKTEKSSKLSNQITTNVNTGWFCKSDFVWWRISTSRAVVFKILSTMHCKSCGAESSIANAELHICEARNEMCNSKGINTWSESLSSHFQLNLLISWICSAPVWRSSNTHRSVSVCVNRLSYSSMKSDSSRMSNSCECTMNHQAAQLNGCWETGL